MANYYSDHPEIGFYLNHPLMARIVELKEKGFADAKEYDYAPVDLGDAIENYTLSLHDALPIYSDHPEIGFYLNHPLMARIVELKEKGFADAKE